MKKCQKAAQIVGWPQRIVKGHPLITAIMLLVLRHLKEAKEAGLSPVSLAEFGLHKATLTALLDRDWIYEARVDGQARYGITARGERELRFYESPVAPRRTDGLCPACGLRPRHVSATGRVNGYCYECGKVYEKRQRDLGRPRLNPNRLCSMCRERPVHICSTGRPKTYCAECLKKHRRQEKARRQARWRAMIAAGDPPRCYKCGAPVHFTEHTIYELCYDHYREYQNGYNRRRDARRRVSAQVIP